LTGPGIRVTCPLPLATVWRRLRADGSVLSSRTVLCTPGPAPRPGSWHQASLPWQIKSLL